MTFFKNIYIPIILLAVATLFSLPTREERLESARHPERVLVLPPRARPMTVPVPYFEDFESGGPGWTTAAFTTSCQWQWIVDPDLITVHTDIYGASPMVELGDPSPAGLPEPRSGNACFWYGNPENGTFIGEPFDHTGGFHSGGNSYHDHGGTLTSPLFETAGLGRIMFYFWTWWEVECIDINAFDMMYIEVSSDGGLTWDTLNWLNPPFSRLPGWDEYESYSSGGYLSSGIWIKWTYFLEPEYSGHDLMVRFEFETVDALYNGFRGWFIDDFYIGGGMEQAELLRRAEYPNPLDMVDCLPEPNPFPVDFIVENVGGEAANDVVISLELPDDFSLASGFDPMPLGTVLPGDVDTVHWEFLITPPPNEDTTYCWHVILTSADSLIGYHDDFEREEDLFYGDAYFDYCDVRLPYGPDNAISGFGVAGVPYDGSATYSGPMAATLTSFDFDLTGWTTAYLAFWYWLSVPPLDPFSWTGDGEDGFLLEINVDHTGWEQLDEYGVGIILPRYDAYIDEWVDNPLANKMTYCESTGVWVEVVSQDLIDLGIVSPGDILQVRFVFGTDSYNHREGLFIDEFRLSTIQYPIGPFMHTYCIEVTGAHIPFAIVVMPLDSTSSSCECQEIVLNTGGEAWLDPDRVVLWADNTIRFAVDEGNMTVTPSSGMIVAQPSEPDCWQEGWHTLTLDTCYNVLGCNLWPPLSWEFLSDQSPPEAVLLDPSDSTLFCEEFAPVTISITDTLTGVDNSTVFAVFCGATYGITHPAVQWDGSQLIFYPESTGTGESWADCPEICVIAADNPYYCEPNIDTTCFPINVIFSAPTGSLITPQNGDVTACEDQQIVFALADSHGISPDGIVLEVESVRYTAGIDPELIFAGEILTFTPSTDWTHNQAVDVSLLEFYNIYGVPNLDTIDLTFYVDLLPPDVQPLAPQPGQLVMENDPIMVFRLSDLPAGLDLSTLQITYYGHDFDFSDIDWTPETNGGIVTIDPARAGLEFNWGDTVEIEVYICDEPDLCEPNCTTAVWRFYIEPKTVCNAVPNPFTPDGDGINDVVVFDYPHSFTEKAVLRIYNTRNIEVFKKTIQPDGNRSWSGIDDHGEKIRPGLYLYIIESAGRAVCSGTILIIR